MTRLAHLTALLGLVLVATGRADTPAASGPLPELFYHDFRGGPPLPPALTVFHGGDRDLIKAEPEGARISLPNTFVHQWGGVGYDTRIGVTGDFEITATVEILHADVPQMAIGVGAAMRIEKTGYPAAATPGIAVATTIARVLRAGDRPTLFHDITYSHAPGNPPISASSDEPCTDTIGRLRLKRIGPTLYYLWGRGTDGDDFQEMDRTEFGGEEVNLVRLTAVTGRQPCAVDIRLIDLRIRGGPATAGTFWQTLISTRWFPPVALLIGALLVALGIRFLVSRRRSRAGPAPPAAIQA